MKKCIAYRALGASRNRWVPCGLTAERGSEFCKKHGDALIGGVLGLWVAGPLEPDTARSSKMDEKISQGTQGGGHHKLSPNGSHNEAA